jgi:hypothetical protein
MKVIVLKQSLHRQPFQSSPALHMLVSSRTRSYHLKSSFSSKRSLPDRFQQLKRARSSKSNELNRSIAAQVPIATTPRPLGFNGLSGSQTVVPVCLASPPLLTAAIIRQCSDWVKGYIVVPGGSKTRSQNQVSTRGQCSPPTANFFIVQHVVQRKWKWLYWNNRFIASRFNLRQCYTRSFLLEHARIIWRARFHQNNRFQIVSNKSSEHDRPNQTSSIVQSQPRSQLQPPTTPRPLGFNGHPGSQTVVPVCLASPPLLTAAIIRQCSDWVKGYIVVPGGSKTRSQNQVSTRGQCCRLGRNSARSTFLLRRPLCLQISSLIPHRLQATPTARNLTM